MKFNFSLESVLKVREHKENVQKQKLAEKVRMKQMIFDKKSEVASGLEDFLFEKDNDKEYDLRKLRNCYAHLEHSHKLMEKLSREMEKADQAVNKERDKLVKAHRETHMMEKVRDREHTVFRREEERQERKNMDEIAAQLFQR